MSSLLGAVAIGAFYHQETDDPVTIQKKVQAGVSAEKLWIAATTIASVALTVFSFTHGGFWGFLGTTIGLSDLGLNYDTWKGCENIEQMAKESKTFNFVKENSHSGMTAFLEKATEKTIFWKALWRFLDERRVVVVREKKAG